MANVSGLDDLQSRFKTWEVEQFGTTTLEMSALGMSAEVGEMAQTIIDYRKGIRGQTHNTMKAEVRDAIVDTIIFAMGVANHLDINLQDALNQISETVLRRNWKKHPVNASKIAENA